MNNEKLPEVPVMSPELPHNLSERKKLIIKTDLLMKAWAMRDEQDIPSRLAGLDITELIINDCIEIDDINSELKRRGLSDDIEHFIDRNSAVQRLSHIQWVSELANTKHYDNEPILNEHFAQQISTLQILAPNGLNGEPIAQATTYLRRLFVAREKLAALNGLVKFDTTYYDAVLDELFTKT